MKISMVLEPSKMMKLTVFLPTSGMLSHIADTWDWFQEAHLEIAKGYVATVDWGAEM